MQHDPWARLATPFPSDALRWRVVDIDADARSARVVPELAAAAVRERLDAVLGRAGWSNRFLSFGPGAVGCEVTVAEVTKAAVVRGSAPHDAADRLADAALAEAARGFGMIAPVDPAPSYWVDYDPDAGEILHPPDAAPPPPAAPAPAGGAPAPVDPAPVDPASGDTAASAPTAAPAGEDAASAGKSPGQIAIDRLVERLKSEGRGLETAKLLVEYGGYGRDPEQARELYRRLRQLLIEADPS